MVLLGLAFAAVVALTPVNAFASDFRLRVEDLTTGKGVVIEDEQLGDMALGVPGYINIELNGLDSAVTWSLTVGLSKPMAFPFPGAGILGSMQLQSFNMTASDAASVRVTLEDTGFGIYDEGTGTYSAVPAGPLRVTSTIAGSICSPDNAASSSTPCAAGSSVGLSATSYASASAPPSLGATTGGTPVDLSGTPIGAAAGTATPTFTASSSGAAQSDFADLATDYTTFANVGPSLYSLWTQVTINFGAGGGGVSFDQTAVLSQEQQLVPEPATLLLMGTGVAGFVLRRRYAQNG